jgi:twitching motility protein PilI
VAKKQHPFKLLQELEALSIKSAKGLPQEVELKALWNGVGFRIGDIYMTAPLDQVHEILYYPNMTMVPGTLPWVKGLANIRGSLLPVMDLQRFLGQPAIHLRQHSRIMVISQGELTAGLLVDEVMGLKHFEPEERVSRIKKLEPAVKAYVRGAFRQGDITWHLFDMSVLAVDPDFYKVAV